MAPGPVAAVSGAHIVQKSMMLQCPLIAKQPVYISTFISPQNTLSRSKCTYDIRQARRSGEGRRSARYSANSATRRAATENRTHDRTAREHREPTREPSSTRHKQSAKRRATRCAEYNNTHLPPPVSPVASNRLRAFVDIIATPPPIHILPRARRHDAMPRRATSSP